MRISLNSKHAAKAGLRLGRLPSLTIGLLLLICWWPAHANSEAEVELTAELHELMADGSKNYRFVPAAVVAQGQEIYYTLRIRNPGTAPMTAVSVERAVPANTRYVVGSATGAGADISFSVDGGRTFKEAAALKSLVEPTRKASTSEYTHIRWQFHYPLAPKAVVLARFRAVFQ